MKRLFPFAIVLTCLPGISAAAEPEAGIAFFEAKIRPVLVEQCYQCHSEAKQRGGLRLDSKSALLKGGDSGPSLVPGQPGKSLLMKALRHEEPKMPPKGKLADNVLADFAKWIDMGAPDPRDAKEIVASGGIDWKTAKKFWAFQPIEKPALPTVKDKNRAKTPIDRFVFAKLEEMKLQPVRSASKQELIRRATFDLIGLPPTPEEVEAFLNDNSPAAYEKVLDRLLKSPHYGERWGRYWLDIARYAEDQAHTFGVKPNTNAFRYRDWVIGSLNDDMPYDRFVKLQIAADMMVKDDPADLQHLSALGFFGLGAQYYKNTDAAKAAADELDDRVDTMSRGLLGLTVSCARCHDHKFDPIPQIDYYSLAGVFASSKLANLPLAPKKDQDYINGQQDKIKKLESDLKSFLTAEKNRYLEQKTGEVARYLLATWRFENEKQKKAKWTPGDQAKRDDLQPAVLNRCMKYLETAPVMLEAWRKSLPANEQEATELSLAFEKTVQEAYTQRNNPNLDKAKKDLVAGLFGDKGVFTPSDAELIALLTPEKKQKHDQTKLELAERQKDVAAKALPIAHGLADAGVANLKVYLRGNPKNLGEVAPRRFLRILAGEEATPFATGSGRLELADAIASKDNPLTARVMVNRIWLHHFGRGLVGTPSNFGQLGDRPSHPELLDYLAARFIELGWSMKSLHREIMLSSVYQFSSESNERNFTIDGDNRWLWRMNRRRLEVESWRDSMLAVSGKLNPTLGGPTLNLMVGDNFRRTVYAKISRNDLNQFLRLFDFPDANITSERRSETTVPQQQLFVLNSPFVIDLAKALAARVQADAKGDTAQVERIFALMFGRPPTADEKQLALDFVSGQDSPQVVANNKLNRWERFAQILLASNEFMYVD